MKNLFIALSFLLAVGRCANADITVKDYQSRITSPDSSTVDATKIYIQGLGDGFGWANSGPREPVYCEPPHMGLALANYLNIIDRQIAFMSRFWTREKLDGASVGLVLYEGLKATFPCGAK
jgi:hypothetical protein